MPSTSHDSEGSPRVVLPKFDLNSQRTSIVNTAEQVTRMIAEKVRGELTAIAAMVFNHPELVVNAMVDKILNSLPVIDTLLEQSALRQAS
ncbi:hypothetical protein MSAN_00549500 [Mycena sanguinolenta]|uniref:Uncharacterized protein n=1 Tax=Mycena sanguinolenta TaxID=230812 RepID=A0A8H6ZA00_9AGAR|nr:hypothetical protein MSAN_00549500 [Mycena sanguinolenta]